MSACAFARHDASAFEHELLYPHLYESIHQRAASLPLCVYSNHDAKTIVLYEDRAFLQCCKKT